MLSLALSLVQRQQKLLHSSSVDLTSIQDDLNCLTHLADGDKGVAWADQTRISTNDLQDVNVSSFSLTQQQLFDCFLEHSSPRVRGGLRRDSPQLFPSSLSILTSTTACPAHKEEPDGKATPTQLQIVSRATPTPPPTPRLSAAGTGTVTVRASHTISSRDRNADSAAPGGGSVTVTTDVRISSDLTGSDPDDLSDVSASSGVGTYSLTSEPTAQSDALDYDLLEKKTTPTTTTTTTTTKLTVAERTRTPAFDLSKTPRMATPTRSLHTSKSLSTPLATRASAQSHAPIVGVVPQPYSMFQPFKQRPPIRSLSSSQVATPPQGAATPLSSAQKHSVSTETGIGRQHRVNPQASPSLSSLPQPGHLTRARGQLLIPNRPMANGFMVRSSPSSSYYGNGGGGGGGGQMYHRMQMNAFEDNFVSPPHHHQQQQQQQQHSAVKPAMKAPIGARLKSPFASLPAPFLQRQQTATPNPYVKAPAHPMPRPPHVYQSITIPGPTHLPRPPSTMTSSKSDSALEKATPRATPTADQRSNLSRSTALSGSRCSLAEENEESSKDALNSTFTVEVGVSKSNPGHAQKPLEKREKVPMSAGKKGAGSQQQGGGGRGIFSRSRSPSKLPSYLKMTKSAESKKVSR